MLKAAKFKFFEQLNPSNPKVFWKTTKYLNNQKSSIPILISRNAYASRQVNGCSHSCTKTIGIMGYNCHVVNKLILNEAYTAHCLQTRGLVSSYSYYTRHIIFIHITQICLDTS